MSETATTNSMTALDGLFVRPVHGPRESLAELFHENTKLHPAAMPEAEHTRSSADPIAEANLRALDLATREMELVVSTSGKTYRTATTVRLPNVSEQELGSLQNALACRKSTRQFGTSPMTDRELSVLLRYAYGVNRERSDEALVRYVPSAGRLFPLEMYVACSQRSGSVENGVYHYDRDGHALEQLSRGLSQADLCATLTVPEFMPNSSALLFVTGILPRLNWKYGERGYRYLLLEAGHVGQNVYLVAAALGLGVCGIAGYYDDIVHDLLRIDGVSEVILYAFALGSSEVEPPTHTRRTS